MCGELVVGQTQRQGRLERPHALGIHRCTADLHTVVLDDHGAVGLGLAGDHRLGVIGGVTRVQVTGLVALVVEHRLDHRLARRHSIDHDHKRIRGFTQIARLVLGLDLEAVGVVEQRRGRGEAPVAIGIGHDVAQQAAVVIDQYRAALLRLARQRRGRVVGALAPGQRTRRHAHVVVDLLDRRLARRGQVDLEVECPALLALAIGNGGDRGGQAVLAFAQGRARGDAPIALGVGHGATQQRAAFVEFDRATGSSRAMHGRGGVVGDATGADRAGHAAGVVVGTFDLHCHVPGIHLEGDAVGLQAHIAGRVDHLVLQGVLAILQPRRRGEAPVAIGVGRHAADLVGTVIDHHGAVLLVRLAGEGRCVVVGDSAVDDRTGDLAFVVAQHGFARARLGRGREVDYHHVLI